MCQGIDTSGSHVAIDLKIPLRIEQLEELRVWRRPRAFYLSE
jgi:hypothetical protein